MPRILVIDDQPHVRASIVIALQASGFDAVGAEDANGGLREFRGSRFDLAMVDLYMPGTDGVTLIKALRERAPTLPIIAMSGVLLNDSQHTALDFLPKLPALADVVCLQKPFRPPELLKAISTLRLPCRSMWASEDAVGRLPMPSILVIDDDQLVREAMQIMLRAGGYDVTVAADGKSGIEAIKSHAFDAAIVDLFMPDMNGLKVMEAVRQSNPTLPLIIASGFMFGGECPPMPGFDAMATEAGALLTLYKPFRPAQVLQAVEQAIGAAA